MSVSEQEQARQRCIDLQLDIELLERDGRYGRPEWHNVKAAFGVALAETMITKDTPCADIVEHLERIDADWQGGEIGVIVIGDLRVWQDEASDEWQWHAGPRHGGPESGSLDSLDELELLVAVHA